MPCHVAVVDSFSPQDDERHEEAADGPLAGPDVVRWAAAGSRRLCRVPNLVLGRMGASSSFFEPTRSRGLLVHPYSLGWGSFVLTCVGPAMGVSWNPRGSSDLAEAASCHLNM